MKNLWTESWKLTFPKSCPELEMFCRSAVELCYSWNNVLVTNLSIATWETDSGEKKKPTDWHIFICFLFYFTIEWDGLRKSSITLSKHNALKMESNSLTYLLIQTIGLSQLLQSLHASLLRHRSAGLSFLLRFSCNAWRTPLVVSTCRSDMYKKKCRVQKKKMLNCEQIYVLPALLTTVILEILVS